VKHFVTFGLALLAVAGISPDVAHACSGCFTGNDANRVAYIVTFVILTVLPLACIGGVIYWLVKRIAAAEAAQVASDADDASPTLVG
jgi:hypothetical protein